MKNILITSFVSLLIIATSPAGQKKSSSEYAVNFAQSLLKDKRDKDILLFSDYLLSTESGRCDLLTVLNVVALPADVVQRCILELLIDKDPEIRANTLYLVESNYLGLVNEPLKSKIQTLKFDKNSRVARAAVHCLETLSQK